MLADRRCVALPEGTPALAAGERDALLAEVGGGWEVVDDGKRLRKTYRFGDFAGALGFVVDVGRMADEVDHHPEIAMSWGWARIEIWTHTVGGLSENDFVFAAKAERIAAGHHPKQA
jgi:4a-hydroxytetrahydrobiopterin dehydratase